MRTWIVIATLVLLALVLSEARPGRGRGRGRGPGPGRPRPGGRRPGPGGRRPKPPPAVRKLIKHIVFVILVYGIFHFIICKLKHSKILKSTSMLLETMFIFPKHK